MVVTRFCLKFAAAQMDRLIFYLFFLTTCAGFKVRVPAGRVVAVRGQPAILGCEFTSNSTSDLSFLIVTWQRVEDSRVIHSFYYQKDQLSLQSPDYRNRTALFVSELAEGNAALRIEPVGPRDVGDYLCTVSNIRGAGKAQVRLEYGAFYTEPRLSLNVSCSTITLLYEAEGFPKPEVRWFYEYGEVLSDHTELSEDTDGPGGAVGMYYLKSSHVSQNSSLKVNFTLKNQLLNQDLFRPVSITYGGARLGCGVMTTVIVVLCVLCLLLFVLIIVLVTRMRRLSHHRSHTGTNGCASRTDNEIVMQ